MWFRTTLKLPKLWQSFKGAYVTDKIVEKVMYGRPKDCFSKSNLLSQKQCTFRNNHSISMHGRRKGGGRSWPSPWILTILAKKGCFVSFEWEKQISPLLVALEKFWKNPLVPPWKKSFRRPCIHGQYRREQILSPKPRWKTYILCGQPRFQKTFD